MHCHGVYIHPLPRKTTIEEDEPARTEQLQEETTRRRGRNICLFLFSSSLGSFSFSSLSFLHDLLITQTYLPHPPTIDECLPFSRLHSLFDLLVFFFSFSPFFFLFPSPRPSPPSTYQVKRRYPQPSRMTENKLPYKQRSCLSFFLFSSSVI